MRGSSRVALAALALMGCGETDHTLSGSIGRTHSLAFQRVEVRRLGTSYAIAYLRGAETVARLAYAPSRGVVAGETAMLDFGIRGNAGLSRATADGLSFPPPKEGTITFYTDVDAAHEGDLVRGRFGVQFVSGDTLSGSFAAPLQISPP
ncbi:MAG: hypothetical protein RMK29_04565 [Myxococcales bacterium]|nr:hypothetical protein [Myxococcota bacterium]MDW8280962.1 hypothetical protein [Myxococcales bacterium]